MHTKIQELGQTSYKVLIFHNDKYFNFGRIILKPFKPDIYYIPSERLISGKKKEIEHISWHGSGQTHIKIRNNNKQLIQDETQRKPIIDINFQEMLRDSVKDFRNLPIYKKAVTELDIKFNTEDYVGPISFVFSIISGKSIVDFHNGKKDLIQLEDIAEKGFGVHTRALSGIAGLRDKLLQYSLLKEKTLQFTTQRKLFFPHQIMK